jgi:hypothetical protein
LAHHDSRCKTNSFRGEPPDEDKFTGTEVFELNSQKVKPGEYPEIGLEIYGTSYFKGKGKGKGTA